jgi:hypothetical protein
MVEIREMMNTGCNHGTEYCQIKAVVYSCFDLSIRVSPNSYIEILMSKVMVLGSRTLIGE